MVDTGKVLMLVGMMQIERDMRLQLEALEALAGESDNVAFKEAMREQILDHVRRSGTICEKVVMVLAKNLTDEQVDTLMALYQTPAMQAVIAEKLRRELIGAMM